MANTRRATTEKIVQFDDPGPRKVAKGDQIPFKIGTELFHLLPPKGATLANIASVLDSGISLDDPRNIRQLMTFAGQIIQYIDDETVMVKGADGKMQPDGKIHGRALIERRLNDPQDAFDLTHLMPILSALMKGWFGRPTGSPRASAPRRRAPSGTPASRARTR